MSRTFEHYRDEPTYDELKEREREEYVEWYLKQKNNETNSNNDTNTTGSSGLSEKSEM